MIGINISIKYKDVYTSLTETKRILLLLLPFNPSTFLFLRARSGLVGWLIFNYVFVEEDD